MVLYPLIKAGDWEGLNEILLSIHPEISRDQLKLHIPALEEKRKRVTDFQLIVDRKIRDLEKKDQTLQTSLNEYQLLQNEIKKNSAFLNVYGEKEREFLLEHLGISKDGQLCLAKRLDYNWQKNLLKKGILEYLEPPSPWTENYLDWMEDNKNSAYTYIIKDLDAIAEQLPKRWKRGWDCTWNYEKEYERNEKNTFSSWSTPTIPYYKNAIGFISNFKGDLERITQAIKDIKNEKKLILKEIKQLRKESPKSFLEQVEASNKLSIHELKRHGVLQDMTLKWLFHQGYCCTAEFILENGKRVDVIGFNEHDHIIAIEVKASKNDYLSDEKWNNYLNYCDEFYFLLDQAHWFKQEGAGLLHKKGSSLAIDIPCSIECKGMNKEKIIYDISRSLTKKHIFGY